MFREGETLICIMPKLYNEDKKIILKKSQKCIFKEYYCGEDCSTVIINGSTYTYMSEHFISLREQRNNKLKRVEKCSKQEKK